MSSNSIHLHTKFDHSAYLCAKCKVLFDTITVYDEHLENCKNSAENYNFDEVLEKLANASQQPITNCNTKDLMRIPSTTSSTAANQQQTASIIVVTAAMSSTSATSALNSMAGANRPTAIGMPSNGLTNVVSASNASALATMSNVTGLATISMPATNFKIIKYPRGHQTFWKHANRTSKPRKSSHAFDAATLTSTEVHRSQMEDKKLRHNWHYVWIMKNWKQNETSMQCINDEFRSNNHGKVGAWMMMQQQLFSFIYFSFNF